MTIPEINDGTETRPMTDEEYLHWLLIQKELKMFTLTEPTDE